MVGGKRSSASSSSTSPVAPSPKRAKLFCDQDTEAQHTGAIGNPTSWNGAASSGASPGPASPGDHRATRSPAAPRPRSQSSCGDSKPDKSGSRPGSPDHARPRPGDDDGREHGLGFDGILARSDTGTSASSSPDPHRWLLPPEPLRPDNPYRKGLKLTLYRHEAPPPFGTMEYGEDPPGLNRRDPTSRKFLMKRTLVEICLAFPPLEGVTHMEDIQELEIVDEIAVRNTYRAQVFVCRLGNQKTYVAKIFDPLYYSFLDNLSEKFPVDTCAQADKDYANEVAAYEELENTKIAGRNVPSYYGSWTFQMSLDLPEPQGRQTRWVRMILMEHVEGATTMLDTDPQGFSDPKRLSVAKGIFEAVAACDNHGVMHLDVCQRNVLILDSSKPESDAVDRVILFDFNVSWVMRIRRTTKTDYEQDEEGNWIFKSRLEERQLNPTQLPCHPARSFWNGRMLLDGEFDNWRPRSWADRSQTRFTSGFSSSGRTTLSGRSSGTS